MDTHGNTQEEAANGPRICANGCGFFANEPSEMCSKCSRELQAAAKRGTAASKTFDSFAPASGAQASPVHSPQSAFEDTAAASASVAQLPAPASVAQPAPSAVQQVISVTEVVASPTQAQPLLAADGPAGERPVQKSTSRCFSCKKKIGLTGFKCRCGYVFCGSHRLAEAHTCDFDYKTVGRAFLSMDNPVVQADRITRF